MVTKQDAQKQQAMVKAETPSTLAKFHSVEAFVAAFDEKKYNVLAPVTYIPGGLPKGTRLTISQIQVNPDASRNGPKEVFPIAGQDLLLAKPTLDRISNAAGISWIDEERKDNGKHPHYCHMFVRGKIRDFDGSEREISGSEAVDLREDAGGGIPGGTYDEIITAANKAKRDPSKQLLEARKFLLQITVSKARNRAIASGLGIKRSYTANELAKPFIIPKLSMDTDEERMQKAMAASMLGPQAVQAMFGAPSQPTVVEAQFEGAADEDGASCNSGESESVEASPPASADSAPPVGTEKVIETIKSAWASAKQAGMVPADFRELCQTTTGKGKKEEMTLGEAQAVVNAVKGWSVQGGPGDLPI